MEKTLFDTLTEYRALDRSRFHIPGHKGRGFAPFINNELLAFDVTEVDGLDSLLHPTGVLQGLQERIARLYGSGASLISTAGSSICVHAMIAAVSKAGGRIAMGRNAHISAINALSLTDMEPVWMHPDESGRIGAQTLSKTLSENPGCCAAYVTSPNYFGAVSDIASLSKLCAGQGIPLLVDNAHGAHLKFTRPSLHPMDAGADLCCESFHKNLPALTGSAVLHVRDADFAPRTAKMLRLFASTSPSYLIMLSIDRALAYMQTALPDDLAATAQQVQAVLREAEQKGFPVARDGLRDPIRIVLPLSGTGYDAQSFLQHLRAHRIEPEYCSDAGCVLLPPLYDGDRDFRRLIDAIRSADVRRCQAQPAADSTAAQRVLSIRQAVFAPSETVEVQAALGRICAQNVALCPPGLSIAVPGERINEQMLLLMRQSGIGRIEVTANSETE